jgi:hypothetical protein
MMRKLAVTLREEYIPREIFSRVREKVKRGPEKTE